MIDNQHINQKESETSILVDSFSYSEIRSKFTDAEIAIFSVMFVIGCFLILSIFQRDWD